MCEGGVCTNFLFYLCDNDIVDSGGGVEETARDRMKCV